MTGPSYRKLREKAGVSINALAKSAQVSFGAVAAFESGRKLTRRSKADERVRAAYEHLDRLAAARPAKSPAPAGPRKPAQTGRALHGVRPGAMDPADVDAKWNGRFSLGWLRSQIRAWSSEGVTIAEMRRGDTAAARSTVHIATEAQLADLGRRLGVAMTGKNLQE